MISVAEGVWARRKRGTKKKAKSEILRIIATDSDPPKVGMYQDNR